MEYVQIVLIAIALSMDACAVSICKGLKMKNIDYKYSLLIAFFFGGFQGLMPLIGWVLGKQFEKYIISVDHWVAFILLAVIGGKMIWEAWGNEEDNTCISYDVKEIVVLAIATSIDALAVGITFAFLETSILADITIIGVITFLLSFAGVFIGNKFGMKYKSKAEFMGGLILILIGFKILLEHLDMLQW